MLMWGCEIFLGLQQHPRDSKLHQLCVIKLAPLSSLSAGTAWMGAGEKLAPPAPDVHQVLTRRTSLGQDGSLRDGGGHALIYLNHSLRKQGESGERCPIEWIGTPRL